MKPPALLKTIIDIAYVLLIAKFIIGVAIIVFILFGGHLGDEIQYQYGTRLNSTIMGVIHLGIYSLFIYAVRILRSLIKNYSEGKLYTRYQISALKLTGQLIILVTVLSALADFISDLIFNNNIGVNIDLKNGFGSFWLVIAIGLFFIYLSAIFANAREIKEENDLTI